MSAKQEFSRRKLLFGAGATAVLAALGPKVVRIFAPEPAIASKNNNFQELPNIEQIQETNKWRIGSDPNYSTGFVTEEGHAIVTAACYASGGIYLIDTTQNSVVKHDTGSGTSPLDVVYDKKNDRIVVASADLNGNLIILDRKTGTIIKKMATANITGKGQSDGGIQGVTIDQDGNYIAALAYYNNASGGVLVRVTPDTFDTTVITKDVPNFYNPNGIITYQDTFFVFSDRGFFFQFDKNGNLLKSINTGMENGYRGATDGTNVWISYWQNSNYNLGRYNLQTKKLDFFDGARGGNSVQIGEDGRIWTAGDGGVAVNDPLTGKSLARKSFGVKTNGLTTIGNQTYVLTYDNFVRQLFSPSPHKLFFPNVRK